MNVTSCILAVFSPTGGTEKIARAIGQGTGLAVRTVDLCKETEPCAVGADELLVAACPVFGGRIPAVACERLAKLRGAGGPAAAPTLVLTRRTAKRRRALLCLPSLLTTSAKLADACLDFSIPGRRPTTPA